MGDFNAKHIDFYCNITNTNGNALKQILNNTNLLVINTNEPTYISPATGNSDILDLILCTPDLASKLLQFSTTNHLSSDHLPVLTTFSFHLQVTPNNKYNYRKADWEIYRTHIEGNLKHTPITPNTTPDDLDHHPVKSNTHPSQRGNDTQKHQQNSNAVTTPPHSPTHQTEEKTTTKLHPVPITSNQKRNKQTPNHYQITTQPPQTKHLENFLQETGPRHKPPNLLAENQEHKRRSTNQHHPPTQILWHNHHRQ